MSARDEILARVIAGTTRTRRAHLGTPTMATRITGGPSSCAAGTSAELGRRDVRGIPTVAGAARRDAASV